MEDGREARQEEKDVWREWEWMKERIHGVAEKKTRRKKEGRMEREGRGREGERRGERGKEEEDARREGREGPLETEEKEDLLLEELHNRGGSGGVQPGSWLIQVKDSRGDDQLHANIASLAFTARNTASEL